MIRTPYGGGVRGALSHSVSIEALFYHVPGLKIVVPSTPADIKGLLNGGDRGPDPVLFLEHKKTYRSIKGEVPERRLHDADRQGRRQEAGLAAHRHLVRLQLHQALDAANRLEGEGVSVEVIDLRSIRPMDARRSSRACARRASCSSCTKTTSSAASAPRSARWSPRKRSSISTRRSGGCAGRTFRRWATRIRSKKSS